jgi:hypothetical protein
VPVLELLDSLKLHSSENIRMWLNAEYSRIKSKPGSTIFDAITIRNVDLQGKFYIYIYIYAVIIKLLTLFLVYIPLFLSYVLVPAQESGFHCGMLLCHYAAAMYYLQDVDIRLSDLMNKLSLSPYFRFNQPDIYKFCAELLLLVKNVNTALNKE